MSNYGSEPIRGTSRTLINAFKKLQNKGFIRDDLVAENLSDRELKYWISVGRHLEAGAIIHSFKSKRIVKKKRSNRRSKRKSKKVAKKRSSKRRSKKSPNKVVRKRSSKRRSKRRN